MSPSAIPCHRLSKVASKIENIVYSCQKARGKRKKLNIKRESFMRRALQKQVVVIFPLLCQKYALRKGFTKTLQLCRFCFR